MISKDTIQEMRRERGWSQEKLAAISGLSERTIQRVEAEGKCSLDTQMALATAFEVSPAELVEDEPAKPIVYHTSWSGALGLFILGLTAPCLILFTAQHGQWELLSFAIVMGYTLVLSITQYGLRQSYRLFDNSSWLVRYPSYVPGLSRDIARARSVIVYAYSAGAIACLVSAIVFTSHLRGEFSSVAELTLYAIRPLFYAVLFVELWFRPYKRRMEGMLLQQSSSVD